MKDDRVIKFSSVIVDNKLSDGMNVLIVTSDCATAPAIVRVYEDGELAFMCARTGAEICNVEGWAYS